MVNLGKDCWLAVATERFQVAWTNWWYFSTECQPLLKSVVWFFINHRWRTLRVCNRSLHISLLFYSLSTIRCKKSLFQFTSRDDCSLVDPTRISRTYCTLQWTYHFRSKETQPIAIVRKLHHQWLGRTRVNSSTRRQLSLYSMTR